MANVNVSFKMRNGKILECRYGYRYTPATFNDPEEYDVGEAEYFIDDIPIDIQDMPKGLDVIAEKLYKDADSDPRFDISFPEPDVDPEIDEDWEH